MANIRATCEECGDVELNHAEVGVRVCEEDGSGAYHFRCKKCGKVTVKPAERRIIDLLIQSGVKQEVWKLPAEIYEAHSGPPITHDDLLDFHTLLQDDDWVDEIQRGEPA